jgi:hypothetical protein
MSRWLLVATAHGTSLLSRAAGVAPPPFAAVGLLSALRAAARDAGFGVARIATADAQLMCREFDGGLVVAMASADLAASEAELVERVERVYDALVLLLGAGELRAAATRPAKDLQLALRGALRVLDALLLEGDVFAAQGAAAAAAAAATATTAAAAEADGGVVSLSSGSLTASATLTSVGDDKSVAAESTVTAASSVAAANAAASVLPLGAPATTASALRAAELTVALGFGLPERLLPSSPLLLQLARLVSRVMDAPHTALFCGHRVAAATSDWLRGVDPRDQLALQVLLHSLPPARLRDVPVFLRHSDLGAAANAADARGTTPYRLVTLRLAEQLELVMLCGPTPSLSEAARLVQRIAAENADLRAPELGASLRRDAAMRLPAEFVWERGVEAIVHISRSRLVTAAAAPSLAAAPLLGGDGAALPLLRHLVFFFRATRDWLLAGPAEHSAAAQCRVCEAHLVVEGVGALFALRSVAAGSALLVAFSPRVPQAAWAGVAAELLAAVDALVAEAEAEPEPEPARESSRGKD